MNTDGCIAETSVNIVGKTSINPVLFYSGKIAGYLLWVSLALGICGITVIGGFQHPALKIASVVLLVAGLTLAAISLVNLGKSTRLGLPSEDTVFKNNGIYRFSRNPMYVGFNCITIAAVAYNANAVSVLAGIYSIVIYHFIILGEERFLENRFGDKYIEYKNAVRRYL